MRNLGINLATATGILLFATISLASSVEPQDQSTNTEYPPRFDTIRKPIPWPNATIPYYLSGNFSDQHLNEIFAAMTAIEEHSCVKFKPWEGKEYDYLDIDSQYPNCFSTLGRGDDGGRQLVNFIPPCHEKGTIIHELMHVLGFGHEQNRVDRDDYLIINWENVNEDKKPLLAKNVETFGVPYDYYSITHYPLGAYSKNGLPTMTPKHPAGVIAAYRELSDGDIKKIQSLYKCP